MVAVLMALFVTFRLTTPARPPLANPAPKPPLPLPPFALTLVELLFLPAAKVVTGKVLDAADASGSNHSLSQHAAAGMSYIDTQAGEERIDFLTDFEKADSTEKPDKHIAGNGFFPTAST